MYGCLFGEGFQTADEERRAFAAELLPSDGERARTCNLALLDLGDGVYEARSGVFELSPSRAVRVRDGRSE